MRVQRYVTGVRRGAVSAGLLVAWCIPGPGCGASQEAGDAGADASRAADSTLGSDAVSEGDAGAALVGAPCGSDASPAACNPSEGLECDVNTHCPDGGSTSVSGTVYDPAGRNPISNAIVFVPRHPASLSPIVTGASGCHSCEGSIGDIVAATTSDAMGHFRLFGVPTTKNLPLVVQAGKWRRMVEVPQVADCGDLTVPAELSRLPRNRAEGDLPQMALLTGGCDNLACFLRSVGVDATEFSAPHAGGRVDVYQGLGAAGSGAPLSGGTAGDCTAGTCPLWSAKQSLQAYDAVLLGCECTANNQTKPPSSMLAMRDWLNEGGTLFATHSQATWFKNGPPEFQAVANWTDGPASGAIGPFVADGTFPKGMTFRQWLSNVGAADPNGIVSLNPDDVSTSVTTVGPMTAEWLVDTSTAPEGGSALSGNVKALSFSTPVADGGTFSYCGKAYFTDVHAGGGQAQKDANSDGPGSPAAVPGICDGGPMTAEEKALEFLFFDRPVCISTTTMPPPPAPCPVEGGG